MDFKKAFDTVVTDMRTGFAGGRELTVGASEIGDCARKVSYRKHLVPADDGYTDTGGFAFRGDVMEDNALVPVVTKAVDAAGGTLMWAGQNDQMRIVDEERFASATPDGLAVNMPHDCLAKYGVPDITNGSGHEDEACIYVEMKSIDPRVGDHSLPKPPHVDQCNYGLGLVRDTEFEEEVFVKNKKTGKTRGKFITRRHQPNYAALIYMNASDYSDIKVFIVAFDKDGYDGQLTRAKWIMKTDPELVRPEGKIGGGKDCRYCEFSSRCLGYSAMVPKTAKDADTPVIKKVRTLTGMLQEAKTALDQASLRVKTIESEIKETLAAASVRFVQTDIANISWSQVKGRVTYSADKMKKALTAAGIDIAQFASEGRPSERLNVEFLSSDNAA